MQHLGRLSPGQVALLCASVLLVACSASRQNAPRQYAQSKDSATNASLRNPQLGTPQIGEKAPVVPPLRPVRPPVVGALGAAAVAGGQAVIDASESLDSELWERIDKALAECANAARSEVMFKHFKGRRPTHEDCDEEVGRDSRGEPITRAMQLGVEQHQVALKCAEERLRELKPGGFSLSPRYRYDPDTGKAAHIPREVVKELLRQGRGSELRGTLEPDIVLHAGAPHQVQAVYDYKFPCVNTDRWSSWREYREGHAHVGSNQRDLYRGALKVEPAMVQPHLGVNR
jgi:hypothetical protein